MWPFCSSKRSEQRSFPLYDVHSHLLPSLDDGAKELQHTIEFLEQYSALGYQGIIATPHTNHPMFDSPSPTLLMDRLQAISAIAKDMNLSLRAGGEIMVNSDFDQMFTGDLFPNINGAYLVEFENRPTAFWGAVERVVYLFQRRAKTLIVAHPERYVDVQQHTELLMSLKDRGVLLQINLGSLVGWFGARTQETAWRLVQSGMADLAATDVHQIRDFQVINSALQELEAFDSTIFHRLVSSNPRMVFQGNAHQIESGATI